jgi:1,4-dihydroxy-2-naphthoyl-CoA synthase
MAYETVRYEVNESILTITLNRPEKLNAFTTQMLYELIDVRPRRQGRRSEGDDRHGRGAVVLCRS